MKIKVYETMAEVDVPFESEWQVEIFLRDLGIFRCAKCGTFSQALYNCPDCHPLPPNHAEICESLWGPRWQSKWTYRP